MSERITQPPGEDPTVAAIRAALRTEAQDAAGIKINTRTLLFAASLLVGGGLGGGGVSFATGPTKDDFAALKRSVETVAVAAVEIKAELRNSRDDIDEAERDIADHEKRLRVLERGGN